MYRFIVLLYAGVIDSHCQDTLIPFEYRVLDAQIRGNLFSLYQETVQKVAHLMHFLFHEAEISSFSSSLKRRVNLFNAAWTMW